MGMGMESGGGGMGAASGAVPHPLVSVVVPAYNAAATLAGAVGSVGADPAVAEILVIDDGSSDDTARIARDLPGVTLIQQPNAGPSAARNAGIERARGDWVAFLDADDRWLPGKLSRQLAVAARQPEAVIVATEWLRRLPEGHGSADGSARSATPAVRVLDYQDFLVMNRFQTSTVLARTTVLRELGGFRSDLDGAEDYDMWLRCATRGPAVLIREPLVIYRDEPGGYSKDTRRVYTAALAMMDREQAAARVPRRRLETIRAWHHLRFAIAFALAHRRAELGEALGNLRRDGLLGQVPLATLRYVAPYLAGRLRRRRVPGARTAGR